MDTLTELLAHYHAFLAHFPIALVTMGALVRVFWALRPTDGAWAGSEAMLGIGAACAFVSILSGLVRVHFHWDLHPPLLWHRNGALALGVWSLVHLTLLLWKPQWMQTRLGAPAWALVGAALALLTGYFGAEVAG